MTVPLVLLTRPGGTNASLASFLERHGFRVAAVATVATEPVASGGPLDDAAARLADYEWAVLTSATGVRALADARERVVGGLLRTDEGRPRWAAVGAATARALEAAGVAADVVPPDARSSAIPDALLAAAGGTLAGSRVLLARADAADEALPRALESAGAVVDDVIAYRTVEAPAGAAEPLAKTLDDPDLAAAVVASGSAVRGLVGLAERTGRIDVVRRLRLVSIGPSTSAAARALGFEIAAEAAEPTPESLAEAVVAAVQEEAVR